MGLIPGLPGETRGLTTSHHTIVPTPVGPSPSSPAAQHFLTPHHQSLPPLGMAGTGYESGPPQARELGYVF